MKHEIGDMVVYVPSHRYKECKTEYLKSLYNPYDGQLDEVEVGKISSFGIGTAFVQYRFPKFRHMDSVYEFRQTSQSTRLEDLINFDACRRNKISNIEKKQKMMYNKLKGIDTFVCFEHRVDFVRASNPASLTYIVRECVDIDGEDQVILTDLAVSFAKRLDEVFLIE